MWINIILTFQGTIHLCLHTYTIYILKYHLTVRDQKYQEIHSERNNHISLVLLKCHKNEQNVTCTQCRAVLSVPAKRATKWVSWFSWGKKTQNFYWACSVTAGGPQVLLLMGSSVNKFFFPRKSQNKLSNLTFTKYSFYILHIKMAINGGNLLYYQSLRSCFFQILLWKWL